MEYFCNDSSESNHNSNSMEEIVEDLECPCGDATLTELVGYKDTIQFWLEGVALYIIGIMGLVCNMFAIPILLSK